MTLILNQSDLNDLYDQAPVPEDLAIESFETVAGMPESLGQGYSRSMELSPGVTLNFSDHTYHQDLIVKAPVHDHEIQIGIHLSGSIYFDEVHPNLGGDCGYFSGSGVSPAYVEKHRGGERVAIVSVDIDPAWLEAFLLREAQGNSELRKLLFKGDDWKTSFYPTVTPAMRSIAQQLWNAPYQGMLKQIYFQAKAMELLVMCLDRIAENPGRTQSLPGLKPDTIARLHYAKEILTAQLENPPLVSDLAAQVGVSDRTLRRGFQELFGTTVIGYLTRQRMQQAQQLLQEGRWTVAEVARTVGYGHLGNFAAAFRRQFGITPKECLMGKLPGMGL